MAREADFLPVHLNGEAAPRGLAATIHHESLAEYAAAVHSNRARGRKHAPVSLQSVQDVAGSGAAKGARVHPLVLSRVFAEHETLFPKQLDDHT